MQLECTLAHFLNRSRWGYEVVELEQAYRLARVLPLLVLPASRSRSLWMRLCPLNAPNSAVLDCHDEFFTSSSAMNAQTTGRIAVCVLQRGIAPRGRQDREVHKPHLRRAFLLFTHTTLWSFSLLLSDTWTLTATSLVNTHSSYPSFSVHQYSTCSAFVRHVSPFTSVFYRRWPFIKPLRWH